jgi:hypothetical protein
MRRLARRLFTVCSVLSLLLCVAVCVLWARSYSRWDSVMRAHVRPQGSEWHYLLWGVRAIDGGARVSFLTKRFDARLADNRFQQQPGRWYVESRQPPAGVPRQGTLRRFTFASIPYPGVKSLGDVNMLYMHSTGVTFPLWPLALGLATGGLPSILLLRRRLLRPKAGLCRACGYDLRATPGRCPECGTIAAEAAASPAAPAA